MSKHPALQPSETLLEGKWIYSGGLVVADETSRRIEFLIKEVLLQMASDVSGWQVMYRDPADWRIWELSYPDSGSHGGGAPTLKCLDSGTVNRETAIALAHKKIDELANAVGDEFEILPGSTREIEQGWVFFYNTADFVRTRNPMSSLAGNGPILVTREGVIQELPSTIPWEDAVKLAVRGS